MDQSHDCPGELHQHAASAPRNNSFPQLRW